MILGCRGWRGRIASCGTPRRWPGAWSRPGSVFAFLAAHRGVLFDDSFTADLFGSGAGRPSLPADLVGSVLVLKELYALSDRQTAEAVMYDIRWKVACGRSLTAGSFDPTTLVYWRRRIAKSDRPDRVFDKVAEVIAETGLLKRRRRRCVDSTVFDDAVATHDTVTQLVAAIRKVARTVPGAAAVVTQVCRGDYSRAGKPDIDWDDPQAKAELVSILVNDALAVLARLCGPDAPSGETRRPTRWDCWRWWPGRTSEPAERVRWRRWAVADRPAVGPDRVISTVDRQARHTRKSRSQRRDGYRAHLANEPDTGLITDCEMTMATGPDNTDAAMGVTLADRDRFHPGTPQAEPVEQAEPVQQAVEKQVEPVELVGVRPRPCPRPRPARTATASALVMVSAPAMVWRSTGTPPTAAVRPGPTTPRPATTP